MKLNNGYGEYYSLVPTGASVYAESTSGNLINSDQNFTCIFPVDKSTKNWSLAITSSSAHNGTTSAYSLQYSVDGTNWVNLKTSTGLAVGEAVAVSSTYIVNSNGLYSTGLVKLTYAKGNASAGTILVSLSYGN